MKKLEKHQVYNITKLAKIKWNYESCYIWFYLYIDNQNAWLYRVMEWVYDDSENKYTIERNNLYINNLVDLIEELDNDDLSNWDYETFNNLQEWINEIISQWKDN